MKTHGIRNHTWRVWTDKENEIMDRLYPKYGAEAVAKATGRSISSVDEHARRRGIPKPDSPAGKPVQDLAAVWLRRPWTLPEGALE